MKIPKWLKPIIAGFGLCGTSATAQNLISNPGFQSGTSNTSYPIGSTALPGWTVDNTPAGGVQLYPATGFGAVQSGNTLVIQLTGGSTYASGGGINQSITTTPGTEYLVRVDVARRSTAAGTATGNFSFGGQNHPISASSTTFTTLSWMATASSASTLIDITGDLGSSPQLLIDNVNVSLPVIPTTADSTVTAAPGLVFADGSNSSAITVTLKDAAGNPALGKAVTLAHVSGPGTAIITTVAGTTNHVGVATFTVQSLEPGTHVFAATDVTDGNMVVTQTASVTFAPLIVWGPPTDVTGDSDVSTTGTLQYAEHWGGTDQTINGVPFTAAGVNVTKGDGTGNTQTVTWTQGSLSSEYHSLLRGNWYNANNGTITLGNLTPGRPYQVQMWSIDRRYSASQFETFAGNPPASVSIGTGGFAIGTFSAVATTQPIRVSGSGSGVINAVVVRERTPGPGSASNSTLVASPSTVPANGSSTSTVTVTVKDADGFLVTGKTVSLAKASGPGTANISAISDVTNSMGEASFTVASSTAGDYTFAATDLTDGVLIENLASVNFVAGNLADAANSTVIATPANVVADGSALATITVTLKDSSLNSVSNKIVTLYQVSGPGAAFIETLSGITDASGKATFTAYSLTVGEYVFAATDVTDGNLAITQTATVTFTAGPGSAAYSSVIASQSTAGADGTVPTTITVTLLDQFENPVSGKTIALASDRGAADTITPASSVTNAQGVATFTVSSSTVGTATLIATDTTDSSMVFAQTASVEFTSLVVGGRQFNAGNVAPSPVSAMSDDLLESSLGSATGELAAALLRNGTTGTAFENSVQNPARVGATNVTYNLNLATSPGGYAIREIRVFSGWEDDRSGQSYRIEYATVAAPANFIIVGTVSAPQSTGGSLLTKTYSLGGTDILVGVASIRFVMTGDGLTGGYSVFREIDILGSGSSGNSPDYDAWAANYPGADLTNPAGDADGDGATNQEEYAFGLDPTSGASVNPVTAPLNPSTQRFSYTRRTNSGLTYQIFTTSDLSSWNLDSGATEENVVTNGDVQTVTVQVAATATNGRLFVKVQTP